MESEAMACYFRNCAALQAARAEPCFIYDHPESVARHEQVMLDVLGCLRRRCGTPTTLTEYACWWQGRLGARFTVRSTERDITIEAEAESVLLPISVQLRGVAATIPLRNGRSALGPLDWRRVPVVTVPAATRRPDLRARARQRVRAVRKHLQERRY
jgi:hypothetical protein